MGAAEGQSVERNVSDRSTAPLRGLGYVFSRVVGPTLRQQQLAVMITPNRVEQWVAGSDFGCCRAASAKRSAAFAHWPAAWRTTARCTRLSTIRKVSALRSASSTAVSAAARAAATSPMSSSVWFRFDAAAAVFRQEPAPSVIWSPVLIAASASGRRPCARNLAPASERSHDWCNGPNTEAGVSYGRSKNHESAARSLLTAPNLLNE